MNIPRSLAPLVIAGLLLTGCAQAETPEIAAPPVVPSATPTPTPTPEPTQPAVDELVVSPEGLGDVVMGEAPVAVDPALDIIVLDEDYCQEAYDDGAIDSPAKWIPNYEPALSAESREPFSLFVPHGTLSQISIDDPAIVTAEGLGLGSTLDEVLAAYPDIVKKTKGFNTDLYILKGEHGRLVFEIGAPGAVDYEVGVVEMLRVYDLDSEIYGWANTDSGFSHCVSA